MELARKDMPDIAKYFKQAKQGKRAQETQKFFLVQFGLFDLTNEGKQKSK